jgi:hypothetical protein
MANKLISIPAGSIESSILLIRGQKVILDRTLAKLYGVSTRVLKEAVNRNPTRFPPSFVFQLTTDESSTVNSKSRPYAFTEHGILMLSSVLNSERAIQVNIEIMRTFVRLREPPASNAELTKRLDALEHDCKVVLEAIRKPMRLAIPRRKEIGFRANTVKR